MKSSERENMEQESEVLTKLCHAPLPAQAPHPGEEGAGPTGPWACSPLPSHCGPFPVLT